VPVVGSVLVVLLSGATLVPAAAQAGTLELTSCSFYGDYVLTTSDDIGSTWVASGNSDFAETNACPQGRKLKILANQPAPGDTEGEWATTTPPAIQLTSAETPAQQVLVNPEVLTGGYRARYLWDDGSVAITSTGSCCGGMDYGTTIDHSVDGHWFGIQVYCPDGPKCDWPGNQNELLDIGGVVLSATDDTSPVLTPVGATNLWDESTAFVRGTWPIDFKASADDGICDMWAAVDGNVLPGPTAVPDTHSWTQCPDPQTWHTTVDTSAYPDGSLTVQLGASDAASPANMASPSETLHVDNAPVALSLSGPTDALSTAGTQHVTATATAGPSGVAGIYCAVDDSPFVRHAGASAQIPVQGIGAHHVSCYAQNNALDAAGSAAVSPIETWDLSIRQPSVSTVSFDRLIDALRCRRVTETVRIPARWVKVRAHGQTVRVKLPAQTRRVRVTRCRPRIVHRRVLVGGRWYRESIVVLPHTVRRTTVRTKFDSGVVINGWLGTAQGNALASQPLTIMTAPNVPGAAFRVVGRAATRPDGTWAVALPAGPSRVVQVRYAGTATVEPSDSTVAHVIVPASVKLAIHPRTTHWGDTIAISGRLRGCCVPPAGELVSLRIGWRGGSAELGQVYARTGGRFRTRYTFLRGSGVERYRIWATTATESDYPYASGSSSPAAVTVGPP